MVKASAEILIRRPPEQVYGFVAREFFANYPRWSPEVRSLEVLTPGPIRVGSRARQVRVDRGRRTESTFRVIALDDPVRLEFAEVTDLYRIAYRLMPDPGPGQGAGMHWDGQPPLGDGATPPARTRLRFAFEMTRLELYMRPFERLIRAVVQSGAEGVVRNIKGLIEREISPSAGSLGAARESRDGTAGASASRAI